uniref:Aromatic-L-amino-acid decarboxylase n=1 Tax=Parascaris univalens TaxID=6257 RepID=A0A915AUC3_PARUN
MCFNENRHSRCMTIQDGSPGMLELEMVATSWVGKALGLPSCFLPGRRTRGGGLLLTTTTEGMFTAILAARQKKLREILNANAADRGKEKSAANEEDSLLKNMVAYGCSEAHLSFDFGCRLAKVEDKLINPDAEYTMNVDELEHEIMVDRLESSLLSSEDVKNKRTPIFINATFGSAHSCSLDKLDEITKIAKKYNIWVHVDASYAGNYLVCPSYRSLVNGLENANSFSVNLHKCLTQSSHATFFWTTDLRAVKDSIPQSQNMLRTLHSDGSYYELATTASNRYKPLKTYLWLRLCGLEGLRQQITTIVKMTSRFRQLLNDDGRLEDKTATQDFGFITFRCKGGKEEQASQKTYRFCCYIIKSNKMSVTLVAPRSMNMIRMTFNREHFDEEEIDDSWNVLKRLLDDWEAEEGRGKIATKSECERLICNGINSRFTQPSSVSIATPKPSIIIPSPMETIQVPNDIKTSEKGQIRPRNFENGQDNRIMKNSAVCDSMENAKEIPQNTTPLQTSAKEISNKAASMREKSEEKRSAKDTEASSSSEKEEDAEEGKRLSTRTGNRQISSTSEGEEFPSERNENSTSSQSFGRSSGRQQPSAAEGGNSAAKKASTSSFKTLKTECLQRSKHKLPEQTGKKLSRNEKRYNTEGSTSKRK